jgi:APA family basic amino acid/polyamine antiporter
VIAGEAGGAIWVAMLVALLLALLTAAFYAELVTKYPRAGGSAVFAERAFRRPVISFLVGYCMLAAGVTSAAGLSLAFAGDYLAVFLDVPAVPAALVFLLLVAVLIARGIQESVRANVVMTVVEVSGLLLVVVLGAVVVGRGDGDVGRTVQFPEGVSAGSAVLAAAILAYYSFVGFETSANVAEEVRDVRRVYPRALFGALLTAGVVYVLVGLVASLVLPAEDLAGSSGPLLDVVRATGVGVPDWLFSAIALIAVANGALLTMIMASRMVFGLAEQRLLPPVLGRVLPRRRPPWVAIAVTTAVAMALNLVGDLGAPAVG